MKKNNTSKNNKRKGFTLVELLAVIIILAIVVGITIPAVLTTTSKAKEKAFKTAANTMADWLDRQYQIYTTGLQETGVATLDSTFKAVCEGLSSGCGRPTSNSNGTKSKVSRAHNMLLIAAGLSKSNVNGYPDSWGKYYLYGSDSKSHTLAEWLTSTSTSAVAYPYSYFFINEETGRSCVTLIANPQGDYNIGGTDTKLKMMCGGSCQSLDIDKADYCKEGYFIKYTTNKYYYSGT